MDYIKINNKKIKLTPQQVKEIQQSFNLADIKLSDIPKSFNLADTKLADIPVGETFKLCEYEFIVLEHTKETTAVISKSFIYKDEKFGDGNNYNGSNVDRLCNSFALKIVTVIGKENLVKHTVDLTSDDGLKDYGEVKRFASLLTANLYRRYAEILDKYKINEYWWLATAYSTPTRGDSELIKCVSPRGCVSSDFYYYCVGVRPFCIFDSNIFVSK